MRKLIVTEFMSLDGVFQAPGPDRSGFKYEGWTFPYSDKEFLNFKTKELRATDMLLLGRVTYDGFADSWPKRSGDWFSDKFNSMPKYVVSKTLKKADWNNSHIIKGNVVAEIKKLKASRGKGNIVVHGSGILTRFVIEHGLVDEITILLYPVVLGMGKRLFDSIKKIDFKLVKSEPFSSGVVHLQYKFG